MLMLALARSDRAASGPSSAQISGRSSHKYPATTGKRRHPVTSSCASVDDVRHCEGSLNWCFSWWQVQGSNLGRLSRRFYRETAA
jgi:hypothetical protein